jgi:predicted ATP-dependent endonuclease of OLD family
MKLLNLSIQGYKNLIDKSKTNFDFTKCTNYVALIGLNGSGKSNVLEAISIIFSSLYHDTQTNFDYSVRYTLGTEEITVVNGLMTVNHKGKINKPDQQSYLPENVIASYSGEELRMWEEIYLNSYADFFQDIKKQSSFVPRLLYINKHCWEYALIALLCSEQPKIKSFITDILGIGEDVDITFSIDNNNYGLYEANDALSLIERIVDLQNDSGTKSVHIKEIGSLDINQKDNADFTRRLFYYLFITGMPVRSERVKADKIIKKTELRFNGLDIKKLSEGEKKLILINCITYLLADDKTLILLDEPDAHIHIDRKKDIIDIINQNERFTLFTTHSPKILHHIKDDNVRIIRKVAGSLEVIEQNKINALTEITNGEYSLMDATLALSTSKDILLVEGTNDYNYITTAIRKLSPAYDEYSFHIINCGGAGNVAAVFEQSLMSKIPKTQLCLCTFDYDGAGRESYGKIKEIAEANKLNNLIPIFHTKIDGTDHKDKKDFYMEDYFPVSLYKNEIMADVTAKTSFKQFDQFKNPKKIIENGYKNYTPADYKNFKVLLDKTISIQLQFHKPVVTQAAKALTNTEVKSTNKKAGATRQKTGIVRSTSKEPVTKPRTVAKKSAGK